MTDLAALAARYTNFADMDARGVSPLYEHLTRDIAADPALLDLLADLPRGKQQPNLFLAATRLVAGTADDYTDFRARVLDNRDAIVATMMSRRTQTNEAARCAPLIPLLASLPQPLALLEVGASAGLCLQPDRYRYEYGQDGARTAAGEPTSSVTIKCQVEGRQLPTLKPIEVAWRAGIDLNPLDVTDPDDVAWLEKLIWPEQTDRLERLRAAVRIAQMAPPRVVSGDVLDRLLDVAGEAPADATLVVYHGATMNYVDHKLRQQFVDQVGALNGHWISLEGRNVFPQMAARVAHLPQLDTAMTLVALDGDVKAFASPHGGWIRWL